MSEAENYIKQAIEIARKAGQFIKAERLNFDQKATDIKSPNQLVSYVDLTAEKMLVEGLKLITPEAGFVTEEKTVERNRHATIVWIVDPLDGTTNFIHGIPVYSVSIGLLLNGKLAGGVVYEVSRDEMFYAWQGGHAYCNGKEIHVTPTDKLENSLLATGFPYYDFEQMPEYLELLQKLMKGSRGLRRLGSAAVDLAYVACGRFDAFFEYSLAAWDVAGGAFIVQQAGGKVTDFSGGDDFLFGKEIVAGNSAMFDSFLTEVKSSFKNDA